MPPAKLAMATWRLGIAVDSDFPRESGTSRRRWSGTRGHVLDHGLVRRGRGFVQLTEPTERSVLSTGRAVVALEPGALAFYDPAPCVHLASRVEVWLDRGPSRSSPRLWPLSPGECVWWSAAIGSVLRPRRFRG